MSFPLACRGRPWNTSCSRGAPRADDSAVGGVMSRSRHAGVAKVVAAVEERTYLEKRKGFDFEDCGGKQVVAGGGVTCGGA